MSILVIELEDLKGDFWELVFVNKAKCYTNYKGEGPFWEIWVIAGQRPDEMRMYPQIPIPVFTDWWD